MHTIAQSNPFQSFTQAIYDEFIIGSGIDPILYQSAVDLVTDIGIDSTGDVSTPIHDALNWHYTRFGHQARETEYAALLLNEDGSCWQAKLSNPRIDPKKNRAVKYETPIGNSSRAFLPAIPPEMRQRISNRYGVEVPQDGSFWQWLEFHPEIPRVWTEGGKKALSLLSQGYVSISLYGVNGGYSRNAIGERALVADVARFASPESQHILAFDQDEKQKTRDRVNVALSRFGSLLQQQRCQVAIAMWDGCQGKGIDDLIVNCGVSAWELAYSEALPLEHWQIWKRLENRLPYPTSVKISTADLSTLELSDLPDQGIIALAAAKGTGKTKFIAAQVAESAKTLAAGHRVALMRNLSHRLNLDYRGDLDKVNGSFINGSAYSLRIGFCVDSLLAFDPAQFIGCDLILDEVVQVVRHLLTSSTCAKGGKRPALLARFRALIQNARRVIVADADLDNATLHYIRELRSENQPVFLIRNTYQQQGYLTRFIEANDRTAIAADLLTDLATLEPGRVLFVATDSKGTSKAIALMIQQQCPEKRVLLINSETSGGELERSFVQSPDEALQQGLYDAVICSPSVATGVSIEAQGIIARVYGIFTGVSATDADMAQALGRVREPVERVVWCAKFGRNYSQVSRSTHSLEVRKHLQEKTAVTVSLIRSSLREDLTGAIAAYDWRSDPHLTLYSRIIADQNYSMQHLRTALMVRLRHEGHQVKIAQRETDKATLLLLKTARDELKEIDAEGIVAAERLTLAQVLELEQRESTSPDEQRAIDRFHLCDFYCIEPEALTVEDVLWDDEGKRRGELLNLEGFLYEGVAMDRTVKALEKQARWNQGICPWDISHAELRRALREKLGLADFLIPGKTWTAEDLEPYATRARSYAAQVKLVLNFTISDQVSDTQIIHQLLSQMGVKTSCFWKGRDHRNIRRRAYQLDVEHWNSLTAVLTARSQHRERLQKEGSDLRTPVCFSESKPTGVLIPITSSDLDEWLAPECLADVAEMWKQADTPDALEELYRFIPSEVLKLAISG